MARVRRSAVAGTWYPADPARLAAEVDGYVSAAGVEPLPAPPLALVSPHAGLMYSGPVAAHAYKAARAHTYSSIVMVGPSHFVPFAGVASWPAGTWETPFGPVAVDEALCHEIAEACDLVADSPKPHGREHSLEMQLPFIARLFPGVSVVPLVMGQQERETAEALGDALGRVLRTRNRDVLLVASSDLSHYEDADTASRMDAVVIQHVEALDADGLMSALEREPRHACGGGPVVSVVRAAQSAGASQARLLEYADSGDVSGDKSAVVGYMAAAIW
jgi:AmmeMemoRadiSam system protein B